MKRHIHENSLAAFEAISDERCERAEVIYQLLTRALQPVTDRDVARQLGFTDMNMVRPRITELINNRWVIEAGSRKCAVTGKTVRTVKALNDSERAALLHRQRVEWADNTRRRIATSQQLSFVS
jgi:hypothetical protein